MSPIRKNSIKATVWIYVGFLIGAINTYFLTHKNWFTTEQNGLTRSLIEIGQLIYAFSCLGSTSFILKFYPYYEDNLEPKKNDILGLGLIIAMIGFTLTATGLFFCEPIIIKKFSTNSYLLVQYLYWVLPLGFFILLYNVLEAYSYIFGKGVLSSILRESVIRFYTFILILLKIFDIINFKTFIALFAFQYAFIFLILAVHLKLGGNLWLNFSFSRVTKKFKKKIFAILILTFFVIIVNMLRQSIDGIVLAAKQNLGKVGIFGLASYMVSVLQVPYRSIIAVTTPMLSRAWKDKNLVEIERIYQRSSINMLGFSLFVFFCVWLNFDNGINFLHINPDYLEGKWVFFYLGIVTIIELGTGVNGQIIGTSTYWRFELWTSLLLTLMIIPLSYYLTTKYGIMGPAIANLFSFTIYNSIRYGFLLKKFNMQPFSMKTLELLIIATLSYAIAYFSTRNLDGIVAIISSLGIFCTLYISLFYWRNISPDVKQVMLTVTNRFRKK
ncbi:MAG: lipopolysaccharide biosynthesis protein [Sphingobacteriales bacterium]|nr:lipopolysaccharide biosynthesis protein [Sphingobacteriales bacterium]